MQENSHFDNKSIRKIRGATADWKDLAKTCVCFANAFGGIIKVGIEDGEDKPPLGQTISDNELELIRKKIPGLTINVAIDVQKAQADNQAEYIELRVLRSAMTIASTSDGRYYMRVSDECRPVLPDELARLATDKNAFVWEERVVKKIPIHLADQDKLKHFLGDIIESERVSQFVKNMTAEETCEHYHLTKDGFLTNLGILWLGIARDRATIHYAPSVQFIKFDEADKKVQKKVWDDHTKNPKEILNDIMNSIPEWNEFIEVSDGIFRKNVYNYPVEAIREILANAFAHRNYTMRGDIFINLFHDRLEIHSPGLLPLGVTPTNILSKSVQRNPIMAKLFYDLKLMEKEGSGFDKVYEVLLGNGKQVPIVEEGDDRVIITMEKGVTNKKILQLMAKASAEIDLTQREVISLGLIAQHEGINAIDLSKILNIDRANGLQYWLGKLLDLKVVLSKGKTKATLYYVNPDFLRDADFVEQTNLKRIEPHRLQELILEDLRNYPGSKIGEINNRIGVEIKQRTLKAKLDDMLTNNLIFKEGERKGTKYFIDIST